MINQRKCIVIAIALAVAFLDSMSRAQLIVLQEVGNAPVTVEQLANGNWFVELEADPNLPRALGCFSCSPLPPDCSSLRCPDCPSCGVTSSFRLVRSHPSENIVIQELRIKRPAYK